MTDDTYSIKPVTRMMKGGQIAIACLVGLALFALLNLFNYDDSGSVSAHNDDEYRLPVIVPQISKLLSLSSCVSSVCASLQTDMQQSTLRWETSTGRQFSQGNDENNNNNNIGGPTFVFVMGIEGSGHHLINSLLAKSPYINIIRKLNMCGKNKELYKLSAEFMDYRNPGLMKPYGARNKNKQKNDHVDFDAHYNKVVELLQTISQKIINNDSSDDKSSIQHNHNINIAINANSCAAPSMLSYPSFLGIDRSLQNFNMDLFYSACYDANVNCKHMYLYRNPYDILKSTTLNRPFNDNISNGIRLYTSVLQQIHSQMVSYPNRNLGCFGFLDVNGYQSTEDWIRFLNLFGFETENSTTNDFLHLAKDKMKAKEDPVVMSDEMKLQMVQQYDLPLMKSFEDIHNRVKDFCYASLSTSDDPKIDGNMLSSVEVDSMREADASASLYNKRERGLVHVFSPFLDKNNALKQIEQVAMLASVRLAKEKFNESKGSGSSKDDDGNMVFNEIVIVCAVIDQDDKEWTSLISNYCDEIIVLPRNVKEQYPLLDLKVLPFVQDIINAGVSVGEERFGDDYYLMLTNSDICLTDLFFNNLHEQLTTYTALTINRMVVSHFDDANIIPNDGDLSYKSIRDAATNVLQQAKDEYESNRYSYHPGLDCFVAHSSIWNLAEFGDLFMGYPPVGSLIQLSFEMTAGIGQYGYIPSNKEWTFHFGKDGSWKTKEDKLFPLDFNMTAKEAIDYIKHCPRMYNLGADKHYVLSGINCGRLFSQESFIRDKEVYRQAFLSRQASIGNYEKAYPYCNWSKRAGKCNYIRPRHSLAKPTKVLEITAMFPN